MYNIKIVYYEVNFDNNFHITNLHLKFKNNEPDKLDNYKASTIIFAALNKTTFFSDNGSKRLDITRNEKRPNIYDISIKVNTGDITSTDIGKFIDYLQSQIDTIDFKF